MKKYASISLLFLLVGTLSGCSKPITSLHFAEDEYVVKNGDQVLVNEHTKGVTYSFVGEIPQGVSLDSAQGIITFSETTFNYSQVLYQASYNDMKSNLAILTLTHDVEPSELTFLNLIDSIIDGDYILANSSTGNAIKYEITNEPIGVEIDQSSGRISFTEGCVNNQEVVVRISSKNAESISKTFVTSTNNLVVAKNYVQACEEVDTKPVTYFLDFSNSNEEDAGLLGIMHNKKILEVEHYTYNQEEQSVLIKSSFLSTLPNGDNRITIVSSNNNINVNLIKATKFIRNATDLASINNDQDSLKGHYILANDIDLTNYLSSSGEGYNDGKGWNPIGTYHDVTDGTATKDAFNGIFDGNGFTISGLKINRSDELAYNAGLFGYVDSLGVIKNLTVRTAGAGLNVRSFSGVIAGNNQGNISNCAVYGSITNYSGENLFKNLGLICGTNGGEVHNVIGYGSVEGDDIHGALIGANEGVASNIFSTKTTNEKLIGVGTTPSDSILFNNEDELVAYNYSDILDPTHWDVVLGKLPVTKAYLEYFSIYSIEINENELGYYTKGDVFDVEYTINPINLHDKYKDLVNVSLVGEGITLTDKEVDTTNASVYEFYISISLEVEGELYTDTASYHLYDQIESVEMSSDVETVMDVGQSYRLKAIVKPASANQSVTYKLKTTYSGITLVNDVVSIDENCTLSTFEVRALAGKYTASFKVTVNKFKDISGGSYVFYKDTLEDINVTFPTTVSLENVKAYIDNSLIEIKEIKDNTVVIAKEFLELIPNTTIRFKFKLADGSLYRCYATYFNRDMYNLEYIQANHQTYHTISNMNEFATYFNILDTTEEGLAYSEAKYEYYDDVFLLTNDIDFGNTQIYGIGTYDGDTGEGICFSGKIYGQGYSFKNAKITDNERWFTSDDKTGKYRNSLYAVGFFKSFDGEIYDVTFDSITVSANNWVALFACTIESNGRLENIKFVNCVVKSTGGTQGKVYCSNHGANNILAVVYNGAISNFGR